MTYKACRCLNWSLPGNLCRVTEVLTGKLGVLLQSHRVRVSIFGSPPFVWHPHIIFRVIFVYRIITRKHSHCLIEIEAIHTHLNIHIHWIFGVFTYSITYLTWNRYLFWPLPYPLIRPLYYLLIRLLHPLIRPLYFPLIRQYYHLIWLIWLYHLNQYMFQGRLFLDQFKIGLRLVDMLLLLVKVSVWKVVAAREYILRVIVVLSPLESL